MSRIPKSKEEKNYFYRKRNNKPSYLNTLMGLYYFGYNKPKFRKILNELVKTHKINVSISELHKLIKLLKKKEIENVGDEFESYLKILKREWELNKL